jgi:hypothetical protein
MDKDNCKVCNKKISGQGKTGLCGSCAKSGKNHPSYKDGRTLKKYHCKDCGKEITVGSKLGRCKSCSNKFKNRGFALLSKIHNPAKRPEIRKKISKALKGRKFTQKHKIKLSKSAQKRIGKNNGFYGKHHTEKTKIKISNNPNVSHKGKNHWNWKNGLSNYPYPLEFNINLKEKIRKRDNYICQCCNLTQQENLSKIKQPLTIHHIDYDKNNCDKSNLITLCHSCNSKANSNIDYWFAYYTYIMEEKNND